MNERDPALKLAELRKYYIDWRFIKESMNQNIKKIAILTVLAMTLSVAITVRAQPVKAFPGIPCDGCAKDFAPGQLSKDSGLAAKDFAPGQEAKSFPTPCSECNGASQFAPGQEKKQGGSTITGP